MRKRKLQSPWNIGNNYHQINRVERKSKKTEPQKNEKTRNQSSAAEISTIE